MMKFCEAPPKNKNVISRREALKHDFRPRKEEVTRDINWPAEPTNTSKYFLRVIPSESLHIPSSNTLWCRYRCAYNTAPNRTSVSARRSRNHYDSTSSCGIATRRSRRFALAVAVAVAAVAELSVAVDTEDTLEVANFCVAALAPAAAAVADDDDNYLRSYGTDVPVRVRRGCTDGPCRVHGGLCALSVRYAMPFFLLFLLLHLRFFLFFLSSFYSSSTLSLSLSFSLCLLSFLHFFTSSSRSRLVPSCALVYSSISSFLLASSSRRPPRDWPMYGARNSDPHLRGSQFLRDPTFFPLFAFSSFASCFAGQSCLPLFGICPIPPPIPLLPPLSQFRVHRFFSLFNGMEHKLALRTPSSSFSSSSASSSSSSSSSTLSFQALPPSYIFHVISLSLLDGLKRLFLTRRKKAGLGSLDRIVATRTLG